jgi:AAA family ATP:ADP antiporter
MALRVGEPFGAGEGGRFGARLFAVYRGEWPPVVGTALLFFLVTATFWVLKPIKRALLLGTYGETPLVWGGATFEAAEVEQLAKVLNVGAAFVAVVVFTLLVRHLRRTTVVVALCSMFALAFAVIAARIGQPGPAVAWSLYVVGDMFNTVMLTMVWALTNDLVRPEQAKRLYGLIGLGGVLGGLVGSTVVRQAVTPLGRPMLMLLCIAPLVLIALIAFAVNRRAAGGSGGDDRPLPSAPGKNVALEGAQLVLRSRYLLGIAGIILIYEIVSNIVDFQLAAAVQLAGLDDLERDRFFALIGQITNVTAIAVQLVVTSWALQRLGVRGALLFLPAAILMGSVGFLAFATLAFAVVMSAADNGLNYSINQSAKEALYVPVTRIEKYKAKAFIDMFVQRTAKLVAIGVNLLFAALVGLAGVRWLSLATLGLLVGWVAIVLRLSREFKRRARAARPGSRTSPETERVR